MTIDQHAISPSICVGVAVTSIYWVAGLDWEAMGRLKLPILGATLATVLALHQIQRYVWILKHRPVQAPDHDR